MGFFDGWKCDEETLITLGMPMTLGLTVLLHWISTNVPSYAQEANIFIIMLIVGAIIGGIEYFFPDNKLMNFAYLGSWNSLAKALVAGSLVAVLMNSGFMNSIVPFTLSLPLAVTQTTESIFGISAFFLFAVVVAPYAEEKFFRMALFPNAKQVLMNYGLGKVTAFVIGLLIISALFGFYHWAVFGGAISKVLSGFVFSTIAIVGGYALRSHGFGVAMHYVNNIMVFLAMGGAIFV